MVGALWLGRLLAGLLFGIPSNDPATLAGVGLVLATVGLIATYVPARRAMHVDPAITLRAE
jgi:putative ABC transport system permease protein